MTPIKCRGENGGLTMDPITVLMGMAPPEWVPLLILAYLIYQGWNSRPNKAHSVNDGPNTADPVSVEEINKPDVKG